jgi:hypothetical protein
MKVIRLAAAVPVLFLFAASLFALPAHTWVATNGSDANSGTALSPYADFATAIANTAPGGIVSVVGPGDYGPITITQSITIDGTNGGSIGFTGGEGIYISPGSNANIVLRNLAIDGEGVGSDAIFIASAGTTNIVNVVIDNCHIEGFTQIGVGLGSESPMYVTIKDTTIQGGTLGVRTFQSSGNVVYDHTSLDHVTIQGATSAGVFTRNGNVDISNSNITGSIGTNVVGIQADTNATIHTENTMITSNTDGVCIYSGSTATLHNTNIYDNTTNIEACGGVVSGVAGAGPSPKI